MLRYQGLLLTPVHQLLLIAVMLHAPAIENGRCLGMHWEAQPPSGCHPSKPPWLLLEEYPRMLVLGVHALRSG